MIIRDKEDELFLQRLYDLRNMCTERYSVQFTHFLDGRQKRIAKEFTMSECSDVTSVFFGGFRNAERCVMGMFPADIYAHCHESELYDMFETEYVKIIGSGYNSFSHRDVLGAVLSLGIKREAVGDILVLQDEFAAYMCLEKAAAGLVISGLESVARDRVKVSRTDFGSLPEIKKNFAEISGTVSSMRLDSIVSLAMGTSREKAKSGVTAGLVNVNHFEETRCDFEIGEGDVISIRGCGRFVVAELGGVTKKGRNRVTLHKMI